MYLRRNSLGFFQADLLDAIKAAQTVQATTPPPVYVSGDQIVRSTQPVTKTVLDEGSGTVTTPVVLIPKAGGGVTPVAMLPPGSDSPLYNPGVIDGSDYLARPTATPEQAKPVPWGLIALAALSLMG